jgi:hypothetical protein
VAELPAEVRATLASPLERLARRLADHRILHRDLSGERVWWDGETARLAGLEHLRFDAPLGAGEREAMRVRLGAALPEGALSPGWRR